MDKVVSQPERVKLSARKRITHLSCSVALYAEDLTKHKERKAWPSKRGDEDEIEERPKDLPGDVLSKMTITIKEINDNRYY